MNTNDYISAIAIERLLEDDTLPVDLRQQAENVLFEILSKSMSDSDLIKFILQNADISNDG